jgi:hypothetical protein
VHPAREVLIMKASVASPIILVVLCVAACAAPAAAEPAATVPERAAVLQELAATQSLVEDLLRSARDAGEPDLELVRRLESLERRLRAEASDRGDADGSLAALRAEALDLSVVVRQRARKAERTCAANAAGGTREPAVVAAAGTPATMSMPAAPARRARRRPTGEAGPIEPTVVEERGGREAVAAQRRALLGRLESGRRLLMELEKRAAEAADSAPLEWHGALAQQGHQLEGLLARLGALQSRRADQRRIEGELSRLHKAVSRWHRAIEKTLARPELAQATDQALAAPLAPGGTFSGQITDLSLVGIADSNVAIYDGYGSWVTRVYTDGSGSYTSPDLAPGTYYAIGEGGGYIRELYDDSVCLGWCDVTLGTPISVSEGVNTPGIDFALAIGGQISGTVLDGSGAPVPDMYVHLDSASGSTAASGYTDSNGDYETWEGVPTGTYYARTYNTEGYINEVYDDVQCLGWCDSSTGTPIGVTAGGIVSGIDFALDEGGRVSGYVTDATSLLGIDGAQVEVYDASGSYVTDGWTDSAGYYITGGGVPAGTTYYARTDSRSGHLDEVYNDLPCYGSCDVTAGDAFPITVGSTTTDIDFALDTGGVITGRVTDSGTGLGLYDVGVNIYDSTGSYITYGYSDSNGDYTAYAGLPTGTYYARTYSEPTGYITELYDDIPCISYCSPTTGTPIPVIVNATTSGIDFALDEGGTISGTITDSGTALGIDDSQVTIYDAMGSYVTYGNADSAGNYVSNALPPGTYYVKTYNWASYFNELYDDIPCESCDVTLGTPVSVTAGANVSGIDFALDPGGRITGTITNSGTGLGVSSWVVIYDSNGSLASYGSGSGSGAYSSQDPLTTGTYYVRTDNFAGLINELYDDVPCPGSCTVTDGTPVAVTTGLTTSGIDFVLDPGGLISGTLTDNASALGIGYADVDIYDTSGSYQTYGYTDASGSYTTFAGLPTGTYYARTYNWDGYVDELYDDIPCPGGSCDETTGDPIAVTVGATTSGIDFGLDAGGRVSGTVVDSSTMAGIDYSSVRILDSSGTILTSGSVNAAGAYTTSAGLPTGTYYARTYNWDGYIDELYDDVPCPGGSCETTPGTPISVVAPSTTSGIDFALDPGGFISGTITDSVTTDGIGRTVYFYDSSGNFVTSDGSSSSTGDYTSAGLPGGSYFARTSGGSDYFDELYDGFSADTCTTAGTSIPVFVGVTTPGVDFALDPTGSVSGTITDAVTTDPVALANVSIYDPSGSWVGYSYADITGDWSVGGLSPGTYYAYTSNWDGYLDELYDNLPCAGGACEPTTGTPITVTAGANTPGIDFALAAGGRITGTITEDGTGIPLEDIDVMIYDSSGSRATWAGTDASGVYTSRAGLAAGLYYIITQNELGYLDELYAGLPCVAGDCNVLSGTPVPVNVGSTTSGVNFTLARGGAISGTVTDSGTAQGLSSTQVTIFDNQGGWLLSTFTDGTGVYATTGLPAGTYYARTWASSGYVNEIYDDVQCVGSCDPTTIGSPISVTAGATTTGVDFALDPGGRVSGVVTDSATGFGIPWDVGVGIYDGAGYNITRGFTDECGVYLTSAGLLTGDYRALTGNQIGYLDELYDDISCAAGDCDLSTGASVSVTTGATTSGVDFALARGGAISGTLTDASSSAPVPYQNVEFHDAGGSLVAVSNADSAGAYMSTGLYGGTYHVTTWNWSGYVDELFDDIVCVHGSCDVTTGAPVTVVTGVTTAGVDFALSEGGRLSGRVTDVGTGLGIDDTLVNVFDASGTLLTTASADAQGNYSLSAGLTSGTYFAVTDNYAGYINEAYDNVLCHFCDPTSATGIPLTAGVTTTGIDFALGAGGLISGTVTAQATATPLPDTRVNIYSTTGQLVTHGDSGASGAYVSQAGLPTGSYFAATDNSAGLRDLLFDGIPCDGCDVTGGTPIGVTSPSTTTGIDFALPPLADVVFEDGFESGSTSAWSATVP